VREGHLPKFSSMIDELEEISISFLGYEHYFKIMKTIDHDIMKEFLKLYIPEAAPAFNFYEADHKESESNKSISKSPIRDSPSLTKREKKTGTPDKSVDSPLNNYNHDSFTSHSR
jgi:hypothetical protein